MRTIATDTSVILTPIATKVGRPDKMKNSAPGKTPTKDRIRAAGGRCNRQKKQTIAVIAKKKAICAWS